jgi:membrane protease YdiL (CAAX protease family)
VLIVYETIAYQLVFFGNLTVEISNPGLSLSVGLNALATGPIEEIPFRGIILYAFLRIWGDSRKGIIRSVLYSAAFFSCSHLIHIAFGRPPDMVAMKVLMTFLSGIYFAALVIRWRTIWTVILFHGVLNAVISIRALELAGFTETAPALGVVALFQIPLVVFGAYLISKAPTSGWS